jgi:hypothetical protein
MITHIAFVRCSYFAIEIYRVIGASFTTVLATHAHDRVDIYHAILTHVNCIGRAIINTGGVFTVLAHYRPPLHADIWVIPHGLVKHGSLLWVKDS